MADMTHRKVCLCLFNSVNIGFKPTSSRDNNVLRQGVQVLIVLNLNLAQRSDRCNMIAKCLQHLKATFRAIFRCFDEGVLAACYHQLIAIN